MKKLGIIILVVLFLSALAPLTGTAQFKPLSKSLDTLCQMVDCSTPPPPPPPSPTPEINGVSGAITPGGWVSIYGSGFGSAPGGAKLTIRTSFNLTILFDPRYNTYAWFDDKIAAQIPWNITGISDQSAYIYISTKGGAESKAWPVNFYALRGEPIIMPKNSSGVTVSCSNNASINKCSYGDKVFHKEDFLGHSGTDIYLATVKNGWVFDQPYFSVIRAVGTTVLGGIIVSLDDSWAKLRYSSPPGSASMKVEVDWGTGFQGEIEYQIQFRIINGPIGVPYW